MSIRTADRMLVALALGSALAPLMAAVTPQFAALILLFAALLP